MGSIYTLLRLGGQLHSEKAKLLGIGLLHTLGKRYLGIFLDPVLACNLRCRMCYFSDPEKRKKLHGSLGKDEVEAIARSLFHRALKLQIGCGAEPTLYKDLPHLVGMGKRYGIPHISVTTNGQLLTYENLAACAYEGLDELILSAHGFTAPTYEYFMTNGSFSQFRQTLAHISKVKKEYPQLKLRINFTLNRKNIDEIDKIWDLVGEELNILQLRPIQKIGESEYSDFDLKPIAEKYEEKIAPIVAECQKRGIVCIYPLKSHLSDMGSEQKENLIEKYTYCYVSPQYCYRDDFDYRVENFEQYSKSHQTGRAIFRELLKKRERAERDETQKLRYTINN